MASELRVNTLKDASGNNSVGMSYVAEGTVKSWIQHNGGQSISDSFNVASITDDGTGDYSNTFTSAMNNNDYAIAGSFTDNGTGVCCPDAVSTTVINSTYKTLASGASGSDGNVTMMAIGDLA